MSSSWVVRMGSGDEHVLNESRYKAFLEADRKGVRFLHIGNDLSINLAFVDKVYKLPDTPSTYKPEYDRDTRSAPDALKKARQVLEAKRIVPPKE